MKRDLLSLSDISRDEIDNLFDAARRLKRDRATGAISSPLSGKTLGMLFNKPSTRTRISFEVGMAQLGGYVITLAGDQLQMNRGETVADTARVFSRYLDAIVLRTHAHSEAEDLARFSDIPVINALTDKYHPCQILADLFTIIEKRGSLDGLKIVYVGDGNNVANSWLLGAAKMGLNLNVATPKGYEPDTYAIEEATAISKETKANIELTNDPVEAAKEADVLYTDTWISMGQENDEIDRKLKAFSQFQLNSSLVSKARPDVIVMHCLPAHRGEEISADVLDGPNSVVWDEAENRLHVQKAILLMLLG